MSELTNYQIVHAQYLREESENSQRTLANDNYTKPTATDTEWKKRFKTTCTPAYRFHDLSSL